MRRFICIILFTCLPAILYAEENLVENGDFEQGKKHWEGDKEIVFETPREVNRICKIKVSGSSSEFHQKFYVTGFNHLTVRFRVKASRGYKGEGINIKIAQQDGGSISVRRSLEPNNEWTVMEQEFRNTVGKSKRAVLHLIINRGTGGSVSFDDIEVVGSKFLTSNRDL